MGLGPDVAPEYTGKTYLWTYRGETMKVLVRRTHCISNGVVAVCKVLRKEFALYCPGAPYVLKLTRSLFG